MAERFIHDLARFEWPDDAGPEVDAAFREGLSRNAARRMTRLGLLCARVLQTLPAVPGAAVIYATSMSEARTLEAYLDSFPEASPMRFQGSVHPAGAQQALIALERPTREFYPLVGGADLFDQALQTALLAEADEVILLAGEEKGGWLRDLGLAGDRSFAFGLRLNAKPKGAQAVIRHNRQSTDAAPGHLARVFDLLAERTDWAIQSCPAGQWEWRWL
jgi:hypothetical protein